MENSIGNLFKRATAEDLNFIQRKKKSFPDVLVRVSQHAIVKGMYLRDVMKLFTVGHSVLKGNRWVKDHDMIDPLKERKIRNNRNIQLEITKTNKRFMKKCIWLVKDAKFQDYGMFG